MATNEPRRRNSFRQLERCMTIIILAATALFVVALLSGALGLGLLKTICGVLTILISGLSFTYLILVQEHKHRRSLWMLTAFASLVLCMLVSMIVKYPAPPVS